MPWDGSGNFQRTNGQFSGTDVWESDANAAIDIEADRHDTHDEDLAEGINACLTKNGENSPTNDMPWGGYRLTTLGDATADTDALNRRTADARYPSIADFADAVVKTPSGTQTITAQDPTHTPLRIVGHGGHTADLFDVDGWLTVDADGAIGIASVGEIDTAGSDVLLKALAKLELWAGGAERATVTSSGVGIGTSSPGRPLDVIGDGNAVAARFRGRASDDTSILEFVSNDSTAAQGQFRFDSDGKFYLRNGPGNALTYTVEPALDSHRWFAADLSGGEQMRLDNTGLGVGISGATAVGSFYSGSHGIDLSPNHAAGQNRIRSMGSNDLVIEAAASADVRIGTIGAAGVFRIFTDDTARVDVTGSGQMVIYDLGTGPVYSSSGTLTNTNPSDESLKEEIVHLEFSDEEFLALQPRNFKYKSDETGRVRSGYVAQEVEAIKAEWVTGEEGAKALWEDVPDPVLTHVVQRLMTRVQALEAA